MKIPFNIPPFIGDEFKYMQEAIAAKKISGDGEFTRRCSEWLMARTGTAKCLLTTSGTHALEMAALLAEIKSGDEIIMPSFTFVSTANAFVLRGAKIVFVDLRPDTMNIDEQLISAAITPRTRAIVPVHYGGVACAMDEILAIARQYNLLVIEDAAQGVMASYKNRALGTFGDFGAYSFHETKNYSMGEGGALLIRAARDNEMAEIIREKGTNRSKFFRGEIDKYTWVDRGSSYLPSELNAAYLYAQLLVAEKINEARLAIYQRYVDGLTELVTRGVAELPTIPAECQANGHLFYLKVENLATRTALLAYLNAREICAVFHYVPLHSAPAGERYGRFHGVDRYTTRESERLLRLPLYYGLDEPTQMRIITAVLAFFAGKLK